MTSRPQLLRLAVEGMAGAGWYADALAAIDDLCQARGWDTRRFVATLAVLSPQVSVLQNLQLTHDWWHYRQEPNVIRSVRVGFDHLREQDYCLSAIRGPKTRAFADALLGDPEALVLDTHMGQALKVDASRLGGKAVRAEARKRLSWVGRHTGLSVRDCQAAIWTGQRARGGWQHSTIRGAIERVTA